MCTKCVQFPKTSSSHIRLFARIWVVRCAKVFHLLQGCQNYSFFVEVRNSENDPYFSRFLRRVLTFSDFLRILQFFDFFPTFFLLSINTYGGTEIPVFRRCVAGMIEYAVRCSDNLNHEKVNG